MPGGGRRRKKEEGGLGADRIDPIPKTVMRSRLFLGGTERPTKLLGPGIT